MYPIIIWHHFFSPPCFQMEQWGFTWITSMSCLRSSPCLKMIPTGVAEVGDGMGENSNHSGFFFDAITLHLSSCISKGNEEKWLYQGNQKDIISTCFLDTISYWQGFGGIFWHLWVLQKVHQNEKRRDFQQICGDALFLIFHPFSNIHTHHQGIFSVNHCSATAQVDQKDACQNLSYFDPGIQRQQEFSGQPAVLKKFLKF